MPRFAFNRKRIIATINLPLVLFMHIFFTGCAKDLLDSNSGNYSSIPNFDSDSIMSVITWIVEWFPKHVNTVNLMAEIIIALNVDIIGFQEISKIADFNQLIHKINDLDSLNQWTGFRDGTGD